MHINPVSSFCKTNFSAKLTRNTKYEKNNNGDIYNKSTTKKELIESYNSQIRAIRAQRDAAIEFDNFMRSEPMKKCLDRFPKKDEIEMINNFSSMHVNEEGKTEFDPMFLMYKFEDPKSIARVEDAESFGSHKADELAICYVQNEDGSINKRGIIEHLTNIAKFLGVKK